MFEINNAKGSYKAVGAFVVVLLGTLLILALLTTLLRTPWRRFLKRTEIGFGSGI